MKTSILIVLLACQVLAQAMALEEGKVYQLEANAYDFRLDRLGDESEKFAAGKNSKFKVHDSAHKNYYVVTFVKTRDLPEKSEADTDRRREEPVMAGERYRLPRIAEGGGLEKTVALSRDGWVSGPLIVPFKYRMDSKSLGGDATIGYYAGYGWDQRFFSSENSLLITPFFSGGLSQVNIKDGDDSSNQTGMTVAAGLLFPNWDGVAIGLVFGQDRIGDTRWEHEGETWLSFMIGWEL